MANNYNAITNLLIKKGLSAPQMTSLLKKIGNGSMKEGIEQVSRYYQSTIPVAKNTGRIQGLAGGSIATVGIVLLIKWIRSIHSQKLIYEELENKILTAATDEIEYEDNKVSDSTNEPDNKSQETL